MGEFIFPGSDNMYLAKLYSKNTNNQPQKLTFDKNPHPYIMKDGTLYSMVNAQLVPDEGYKQTYYYVCVNYENL